MKYLCCIILLLLSFENCHAQISPTDSKKITKILGENFIELTPQKSYPYSSLNENVIADTSLVVPDDTTGIFFNNEFLLFRSAIHFKEGSEIKKMMSTSYVTVAEYQEFQNYIRDSIAREKIYWGLQNNEDAFELLNYKPEKNGGNIKFEREKLIAKEDRNVRNRYPLNFTFDLEKKFDYHGKEESPLLADMYLSQPERFYKKREFDERKNQYKYYEEYESFKSISIDSFIKVFPKVKKYNYYSNNQYVVPSKFEFYVTTISDPYIWAKKSKLIKDVFDVLAQSYEKVHSNEPILGLNGIQAYAFCHWKQERLQKEFDKNKLNYKVLLSLPSFEDIQRETIKNEFRIPSRNYTTQWQISNNEYEKYVNYVKDSILRENLYQFLPKLEEAKEFLDYKKYYFDEGTLMWINFNAKYKVENRFYFNLNFKNKINLNEPTIKDVMKVISDEKYLINPIFTYYYCSAKARSEQGIYYLESPVNKEGRLLLWKLVSLDSLENYSGKSESGYHYNQFMQASDVSYHQNYEIFNKKVNTFILPDSTSAETQIIKKITYEQALAFYHWKYPIHKITATDNWQDFVLPSKEQFEKIQHGEQIVVEEKKVEFPSPVFRYVVHIYPKN